MKIVLPKPHLRVDAAVLRHCTRIAHAFQRLTGRTNYFLAKMGTAVCVVSELFDLLDPKYRDAGNVLMGGFILVSLIYQSVRCDRSERRANASSERTVDPEWGLARSPGWRLVMLWWALSQTGAAFLWAAGMAPKAVHPLDWCFYAAGNAAFYYFVAVDPLPPQRSKIRQ